MSKNRVFGYEKYAHRVFDWNRDWFPFGMSIECVFDDCDMWIAGNLYDHTVLLYPVENLDMNPRKKSRKAIKRALREMAMELADIADWN